MARSEVEGRNGGPWWTLKSEVHHQGPPHLTYEMTTSYGDLVDLVYLFPTPIHARARPPARAPARARGPGSL